MTRKEILEQLKSLSTVERLSIIEEALRFVHEDLELPRSELSDKSKQLAEAAKTLLPDYAAKGDLTAFTALDAEDFHAEK